MFSGHFYHAQIRRMVSVFGTMFNNIEVHKTDSSGKVLEVIKVPISYGPRQKFLARLEGLADLRDPKLAIKLPRMSFEIVALTYDNASTISRTNKIRIPDPNDSTKYKTMYGPIPYRLGFQLNILSKNQDDALQILEQILPYFKPDYTVTINDVPEMGIKTDTPITLQSVTMSDDYEGDFESRRAIIYTLEFETRVRFYTGVADQGFIRTAQIDYNDTDSSDIIQRYTVTTDPADAAAGDTNVPKSQYDTLVSDGQSVDGLYKYDEEYNFFVDE